MSLVLDKLETKSLLLDYRYWSVSKTYNDGFSRFLVGYHQDPSESGRKINYRITIYRFGDNQQQATFIYNLNTAAYPSSRAFTAYGHHWLLVRGFNDLTQMLRISPSLGVVSTIEMGRFSGDVTWDGEHLWTLVGNKANKYSLWGTLVSVVNITGVELSPTALHSLVFTGTHFLVKTFRESILKVFNKEWQYVDTLVMSVTTEISHGIEYNNNKLFVLLHGYDSEGEFSNSITYNLPPQYCGVINEVPEIGPEIGPETGPETEPETPTGTFSCKGATSESFQVTRTGLTLAGLTRVWDAAYDASTKKYHVATEFSNNLIPTFDNTGKLLASYDVAKGGFANWVITAINGNVYTMDQYYLAIFKSKDGVLDDAFSANSKTDFRIAETSIFGLTAYMEEEVPVVLAARNTESKHALGRKGIIYRKFNADTGEKIGEDITVDYGEIMTGRGVTVYGGFAWISTASFLTDFSDTTLKVYFIIQLDLKTLKPTGVRFSYYDAGFRTADLVGHGGYGIASDDKGIFITKWDGTIFHINSDGCKIQDVEEVLYDCDPANAEELNTYPTVNKMLFYSTTTKKVSLHDRAASITTSPIPVGKHKYLKFTASGVIDNSYIQMTYSLDGGTTFEGPIHRVRPPSDSMKTGGTGGFWYYRVPEGATHVVCSYGSTNNPLYDLSVKPTTRYHTTLKEIGSDVPLIFKVSEEEGFFEAKTTERKANTGFIPVKGLSSVTIKIADGLEIPLAFTAYSKDYVWLNGVTHSTSFKGGGTHTYTLPAGTEYLMMTSFVFTGVGAFGNAISLAGMSGDVEGVDDTGYICRVKDPEPIGDKKYLELFETMEKPMAVMPPEKAEHNIPLDQMELTIDFVKVYAGSSMLVGQILNGAMDVSFKKLNNDPTDINYVFLFSVDNYGFRVVIPFVSGSPLVITFIADAINNVTSLKINGEVVKSWDFTPSEWKGKKFEQPIFLGTTFSTSGLCINAVLNYIELKSGSFHSKWEFDDLSFYSINPRESDKNIEFKVSLGDMKAYNTDSTFLSFLDISQSTKPKKCRQYLNFSRYSYNEAVKNYNKSDVNQSLTLRIAYDNKDPIFLPPNKPIDFRFNLNLKDSSNPENYNIIFSGSNNIAFHPTTKILRIDTDEPLEFDLSGYITNDQDHSISVRRASKDQNWVINVDCVPVLFYQSPVPLPFIELYEIGNNTFDNGLGFRIWDIALRLLYDELYFFPLDDGAGTKEGDSIHRPAVGFSNFNSTGPIFGSVYDSLWEELCSGEGEGEGEVPTKPRPSAPVLFAPATPINSLRAINSVVDHFIDTEGSEFFRTGYISYATARFPNANNVNGAIGIAQELFSKSGLRLYLRVK